MKKLMSLSVCAAMVATSLGVTTSNWTPTAESDFKSGTFDNVVATNLGDLKLSRAVRMLLQQNPRVSSVNSMVQAADGTIYAGTGPHGLLLKIVKDEVTELATIDGATHSFALALDKEGALLIGASGESGRVLKIAKPGEKPVELFKADGVQYVWSIAQTEDDRLYVGTEPIVLVYRVNRRTNERFAVYDAPEAEISALVMDRAGNVYAGTAEARDEPQPPPRPPAAPVAGRPESQPAGVPIPSK